MRDGPSSPWPSGSRRPPRLARNALGALARRPDLWATAAAAGRAMVPPGWWRHWPPAPTPPQDYEAFRYQTMFGSSGEDGLSGGQLVGYLEWCRAMRRLR